MLQEEKKQLEIFALNVREDIVKSTTAAGSGHPGGSLAAADYLTYLYEKEIKVDPKNPEKFDRDRFVLSKGHSAPALYSVLAREGFFPVEDLITLRKKTSYLQGHPCMNSTPGIDMSTGSLGQGISAACGMAKGAKVLGLDINVYALLGDGEIAEGEVWEAMLFAAHYKLNNLCIAVDVNGLQIDGKTSDVMNTEPLDKKFEAFGCKVIKIDGHNFDELEKAFNFFHENKSGTQPTVILLKTIKGKGVSFMENVAGWHGKAAKPDECEKALAELENARKSILGNRE
ncbi:MAG: transketolase [Selenomonadaceae bacterium]|nr:transketolase [Selenomonadaceae bacterium]